MCTLVISDTNIVCKRLSLCHSQLFDTIKERSPGLMEEKLFPVLGDMTELRLGLSDEDYGFLVENVSVVFHVAASVRFDEPIRDATIMNVRGTREVVQLAKQMKHLEVSLPLCMHLPARSHIIIHLKS